MDIKLNIYKQPGNHLSLAMGKFWEGEEEEGSE